MDVEVAVRQKARGLASVRQKQSHKHVFKSEADARREKMPSAGSTLVEHSSYHAGKRDPPQRK